MALVFDTTDLFTPATEAELFNLAMVLSAGVGLPVSTWQVGDPTRTVLEFVCQRLAASDINTAGYYASGFLGSAKGDWLTLLARSFFNHERGQAVAATGTVELKNSLTVNFSWEEKGLTFKNGTTDKTYKNIAPVTLLAGASVVLTYEAEETGSGSSALVNSIQLQTPIKGVTVVQSSSAVGVDEQKDESLRAACQAKISSLSPNGCYQASEAVATNALLTGVSACRKAQTTPGLPAGSGTITTYVSNISSLITDAELLAVRTAIVKYGTTVPALPDVRHAILKPVSIGGVIKIAPLSITPDKVKQRAIDTIQKMLPEIKIGGGSGPGFTTGDVGDLLLDERVYQELERWSPGIVKSISLSSDLVSGVIQPGWLLTLAGVPEISVVY